MPEPVEMQWVPIGDLPSDYQIVVVLWWDEKLGYCRTLETATTTLLDFRTSRKPLAWSPTAALPGKKALRELRRDMQSVATAWEADRQSGHF
jgi:hypothetical protein